MIGKAKSQVGSVGVTSGLIAPAGPCAARRSGSRSKPALRCTKEAFGNPIWPHLFRDCAVTELVDCAPEEIGIAPDLLGHADLQTTK
jgi:integrase